jgi:hypothetical protein
MVGCELEQRQADTAAFYVDLFIAGAARLDDSPAAIAHALFLLIEAAKVRREQWLTEPAGAG